jgi:hypothetical protein
MIDSLKLPFSFDASRIRDEVAGFDASAWIPHFNTFNYEGDWSGIALRVPENANPHLQLFPDPNASSFVDTEQLDRCPYTREVIGSFRCEKESARFLKLGAGARIKPHRDYKLSFEDGVARIHVPVITSANVEFVLQGKRLPLSEGDAWYINFNLEHSVVNSGTGDRIHLVIDLIVNDWFTELVAGTQVQ